MKLFLLCAIPSLLSSAILPSNVGPYHKTGSKPAILQDQAVWDEYGLQDSEQATFEKGGQVLSVRAYRLQDATGALAAFQWQRPENATAADPKLLDLTKLAASTAGGEMVALGNHLLVFEGYRPDVDELAVVFRSLPRQEHGPLPTLPDHLPGGRLQPNSERYVIGPASLAKFDPEVSAATAAFHLGTEVQSGLFETPAGPVKLAIFSFPTPEIARERAAQLEKISRFVVKRTGPLVAVVFSPKDSNAAEKLLSQVHYRASITTGQKPASKKDNFPDFIINLFILIGIVVLFCVLSGLVFGGFRQILRRGGPSGEGEAMISLHLGDR